MYVLIHDPDAQGDQGHESKPAEERPNPVAAVQSTTYNSMRRIAHDVSAMSAVR